MWTFKVTPDDGEPFVVSAGSRDVLAWERKTHQTSRYLIEKMPMAELYKIAHLAATRLDLFTGDIAVFESTCDLDIEDGDVEPTNPDHTTEP
jgi:hypothetical protein